MNNEISKTMIESIDVSGREVLDRIAQLLSVDRRNAAYRDAAALIARLDAEMSGRAYHDVPPEFLVEWRRVANKTFGSVTICNAFLLASLVSEFSVRIRDRAIPEAVLGGYRVQLHRILDGLDAIPAARLELESDIFFKDLGICRLEIIPCAAQIVEKNAGIQRRLALTGGISQGLQMAKLGISFRGRLAPFFEIHTHTPMLSDFNPSGWDRCYRMLGELLSIHTDHLGVMSGSWYYDPAVEIISPRLAYLRQVPIHGGAIMLRGNPTRDDIDNATATSPSRRKLYEEGRYKPIKYFMVWPRKHLIDWVNQNHSERRS